MSTLEPQDKPRIVRQLDFVRYALRDGEWRTLRQLANYAQGSEAGVSARIRDLRKEGWTIDRRRVKGKNGLWEYRLVPGSNETQRRLF